MVKNDNSLYTRTIRDLPEEEKTYLKDPRWIALRDEFRAEVDPALDGLLQDLRRCKAELSKIYVVKIKMSN